MAKGIAEGMAKGMAKGMAEGERKKALEIAKLMLANGLATKDVCDMTGLTKEDLNSLND